MRLAHFSLLLGAILAKGPCGDLECRGDLLPFVPSKQSTNLKTHALIAKGQPEGAASGLVEDLHLELSYLYQLVVNLMIGSPPQQVPIVVDSTLPVTIVPSPDCKTPSCTYISENPFFSNRSETFYDSGYTTPVQFGDYVVTIDYFMGNVAFDLFQLGENRFQGGFIYVDRTLTKGIYQLVYHGRLGLGYPFTDDSTYPSVLPQIFKNSPRKMYAVHIQGFNDYGLVGGLEIGGYDESMVDASSWVTVKNYISEKGFWALELDDVAVNGLSLGFTGWSVLNLATPFITVPYAAFNILVEVMGLEKYGTRMYSSQTKASYFSIPCEKAPYLPSISFVVSGIKYTFSGPDYMIGNNVDCVTLFYGHDIGSPVGTAWVFGTGVLRYRMTVFDYDSNTISWASLKPEYFQK